MSGASVTIVTTRPDRALMKLFGEARAPDGVRVVSSIQAVGEIAAGTKCIGVWFEPRKYRSALEWAWIMRRERGGIIGLDLSELGALLDGSASDGTPGVVARPSGGAGRAAAGAPREASDRAMPPVTSMRQRGGEARPC